MTEPDAIIAPRANPALFGHEAAQALLKSGLAEGRLAHGWIFAGPQGIGKATLAYHFARILLSGEVNIGPSHPVFRRIAAGSHADLLVIEPLYDAKKEEYAREISVEQARQIAQFLSLTPGESQWRVVIVDAIDALNVNAANAILKILEEPPTQAVLILISHNPGRLLPTIRSRCRMLRFQPPDEAQFAAVMAHAAPGIGGETLQALGQLSAYAPGVALELHAQEAVDLYAKILELAPQPDALKLHAFADRMGGAQAHANWRLLTRLTLCLFERAAACASGLDVEFVSDREEQALKKLAALHPAPVWAIKWQQCAEQFSLAERLHLDYKQVIITFFHSIPAREGFQIGAAA